MGEKISFRPRARGCCVADGDAVSVTEPRVKFVKGWIDDGGAQPAGTVKCGAGTPYPMLVTVDQLAEIAYRVRTCRWVQGYWESDPDAFGDTQGFQVENPSTVPDPLVPMVVESGLNFTLRGYHYGWLDDGFEPFPIPNPNYWGATGVYDTPNEYSPNQVYVAPTKDLESVMWLIKDISLVPFGGGSAWLSMSLSDHFQTGFSIIGGGQSPYVTLNSISQFFTGGTGFPNDYPVEHSVAFSGVVAFVDNSGSGDPLDTANDLYIGLSFTCFASTPSMEIRTLKGGYYASGLNFKLRLSDGVEISCPLYVAHIDVGSGSDFILEATEWWKYADNADLPAWDSATGLPINGGPGG